MKNLTIKTNSSLFPIINVGMYESHLSPNEIFITDDLTIEQANEFWDQFNNDDYVNHIEKLSSLFMPKVLTHNDFSIEIKTGAIYSPRYYNYETDNIDFEVSFNYKDLLNHIECNKDEFQDYLYENHCSYDGFCSFVKNNYNDWLNEFKNLDELHISVALDFIFDHDFKAEMNEDFIIYVYENTCMYEFANGLILNTEN